MVKGSTTMSRLIRKHHSTNNILNDSNFVILVEFVPRFAQCLGRAKPTVLMDAWPTAYALSHQKPFSALHYDRNLWKKNFFVSVPRFSPLYPTSDIFIVHTPHEPWNLSAKLAPLKSWTQEIFVWVCLVSRKSDVKSKKDSKFLSREWRVTKQYFLWSKVQESSCWQHRESAQSWLSNLSPRLASFHGAAYASLAHFMHTKRGCGYERTKRRANTQTYTHTRLPSASTWTRVLCAGFWGTTTRQVFLLAAYYCAQSELSLPLPLHSSVVVNGLPAGHLLRGEGTTATLMLLDTPCDLAFFSRSPCVTPTWAPCLVWHCGCLGSGVLAKKKERNGPHLDVV